MADFITVGTIDELPPGGEPIVVDINRRWVAIYNIDGNYHAIEDRCTHDDGPLAEGAFDGCVVTCPRHGARFDVTNGEALSGPAGTVNVPTYEVRVVDDEIQISTQRRKS